MGARFTRTVFAALICGTLAVAVAGCGGGCDGDTSQTGAANSSAESKAVIIAEFPQGGATEEISINMDDPLPALVKLVRLIKANCKPVPDATAERPVLVASWQLQLGPMPMPAATGRQDIKGTGVAVTVRMSHTTTFHARKLMSGGSRGFAWCREFEGGYYPAESEWRVSIDDAAIGVTHDLARCNTLHQVKRAIDGGELDVKAMEKGLLAKQDTMAERLARQIGS